MTKLIEVLEDIQNELRYKNFGSILDMGTETLSITHVDTQIHLVIKEELTASEDPKTYSRTFDEMNIHFQTNDEYNKIYLLCQESYLNHLLKVRGHVFLNEVYDALGFERTSDGQLIGWVYNKNDEEKAFIDFGLDSDKNKFFREGLQKTVTLDFNVQGVIYDKIEEE